MTVDAEAGVSIQSALRPLLGVAHCATAVCAQEQHDTWYQLHTHRNMCGMYVCELTDVLHCPGTGVSCVLGVLCCIYTVPGLGTIIVSYLNPGSSYAFTVWAVGFGELVSNNVPCINSTGVHYILTVCLPSQP